MASAQNLITPERIELFPFQKYGAEWLSKRHHAYLGDDMGLGKSAQLITAADLVDADRIVVVCPAIARPNWLREFHKFSDRDRPFEIIEKKTNRLPRDKSIIISYDLAIESNDTGVFDLLIGDEWHFLKSFEAARSRAVIGKDGLVHKSIRTWAASGTPAPNHAGELWLTFFVFGITKLTYGQFINYFCIVIQGTYGIKIMGTKPEKLPELREMIGKIMLRRKKEEVMTELPPISFHDYAIDPGEVDLELNPSFAEWVIPQDRRQELRDKLEKEMALLKVLVPDRPNLDPNLLQALEATANSVSTLRKYTGLQKVQNAAEIIRNELESKAIDKIVIFCVHRDVVEGMREKLKDFGAVTLYGGTPPEKKQKHIDRFQNNPKCRVIVCNIKAAGTAITLTAAHHVSFIEQEWTPGDNAQAVMRCHRIGQTRPVTVRFFGLAKSIDERISSAIKRKVKDLTAIFDSSELTIPNHDYKTLSHANTNETENTPTPEEIFK